MLFSAALVIDFALFSTGIHFVVIMISPGDLPAAASPWDTAFSDAPEPYTSAVSIQLIPESIATLIISSIVADGTAERKNLKNLDESDLVLNISASYGDNIDTLASLLLDLVRGGQKGEDDVIVTNARHFEALNHAGEAIDRVADGLKSGLSSDLVAQDIRQVLHYLGEITGEDTTDEILGNIFSKFCIGK